MPRFHAPEGLPRVDALPAALAAHVGSILDELPPSDYVELAFAVCSSLSHQ